jgi:sugar (pentulose or hexulose) kinase
LFKDFSEAKAFIPVKRVFSPDTSNRRIYDRQFAVFTELYDKNRRLFRILNDPT